MLADAMQTDGVRMMNLTLVPQQDDRRVTRLEVG